MSLNELRASWTILYKQTLPSLATHRNPIWPVHLDHCFARIILDAVVGVDTPWTFKLKAPAWKNMSAEQLKSAIDFGQQIARGELDLAMLNKQSLTLRGKSTNEKGPGQKRKRNYDAVDRCEDRAQSGGTAAKARKSLQTDIRSSMAFSAPAQVSETQAILSPSATSAPVDAKVFDQITSSSLTPFRKRVLLALCQVPSGRFTTYAAMSEFLQSCPRAIGNALRNNPFAPRVPCHRVVASGGGIGGFGGEWGAQGTYAGEKVKLLKKEGVQFDNKREKVMGQTWRGFV